jgi:hypothetical protein
MVGYGIEDSLELSTALRGAQPTFFRKVFHFVSRTAHR